MCKVSLFDKTWHVSSVPVHVQSQINCSKCPHILLQRRDGTGYSLMSARVRRSSSGCVRRAGAQRNITCLRDWLGRRLPWHPDQYEQDGRKKNVFARIPSTLFTLAGHKFSPPAFSLFSPVSSQWLNQHLQNLYKHLSRISFAGRKEAAASISKASTKRARKKRNIK